MSYLSAKAIRSSMASHAIRQRLPFGTTLKKISDDKTHKGFYNASAYKKETPRNPTLFFNMTVQTFPGMISQVKFLTK